MPRFAGLHKNISNDTSAAQNGAENNTVTTTDASSNNILQPSNLTTTTATSANIMNNITDNTVVGKRTPIFKMSTTRRQRRSNKRSSGQRFASSNYLTQMGQGKDDDDDDEDDDENNKDISVPINPMERGRRSGRKKPSNVGIDGEGFEDPSQFFKSPSTTRDGGRLSTDIESTPGGYTDTERDLSFSANGKNNNIVDGISPTSRRSSMYNKNSQNEDGVNRRRGLFINNDNISISSRNDDDVDFNDGDDDLFTQPQLQKSSSSSSSSSSSNNNSNNNSSPRFQDQSPIPSSNKHSSPSVVTPQGNKDSSLDASDMTPQSEESESSPNSNKSTSPSEQSDQYDDDENDDSIMGDQQGEGLVKSPSANNNNDLDMSTYSPGETAGLKGRRDDTGVKRMRSAASSMPSPIREHGRRRSKRTKRQPIEWWKNERVVYERKTDEGMEAVMPVPVGIERLGKSPPTRKKRTRKSRKEEIQLPEGYVEEIPKVSIDLGDTTADIELVKNQDDLTFQTISSNTVTTTTTSGSDNYTALQKQINVDAAAAFVHDTIRTGMVKLDAGATKESESSGDAAQMFCVHKAAEKGLLVNINNQTTTVGPGCMFLVPPNTEYELQNLSRKIGIEIFYTIVDV